MAITRNVGCHAGLHVITLPWRHNPSQITSLTIVYSTVYSRRRSKKTSKLPFDDVIMWWLGAMWDAMQAYMYSYPGPLLTMRTDVLPQCLKKSRSREIRLKTFPIALKIDKPLRSSAVEITPDFSGYNGVNLQTSTMKSRYFTSLRWRHNELDSVSNHQPRDCLLNGLFRRRSKKIWKLRVTGLCAGNSPVTGEFPAQMASNAENVSIWWRHHGMGWPILEHMIWYSWDTPIYFSMWHFNTTYRFW